MGRPRCENCRQPIYQIYKPYAIRIKGLPRKGKVPFHCPNCGAELSTEKIRKVYGYDDSIFLGYCFAVIILIIIIFVYISFLNETC